jgi:hypothetical protein
MKPSSTSSSDRPGPAAPKPVRSRAATTAIAVVAVLAGIEGALPIPAVEQAPPIRTHLHEPGVVVRLQALDRVLQRFGRIDVLFVGSSVVRCNINPLVFDAAIKRDRLPAIVSFNVGMSGLWPAAVRLYLENLWLPRARPRVVVQGIRYGELFPSTRARSYADISNGALESSWERGGIAGRLRGAAFEHLRILQYRGALPSWLMRYRTGRPGPIEEDELRVYTDPRGRTPRTPTLDVVLARNLLSGERPNPALVDRLPCKEALEAIRRSFRATRRAGAQYLLVNVPEHAYRWSGPDGRERYASYLRAMQDLADDEGFTFIDVSDGNPSQFASVSEYSDYHHMSPTGALRFTTMLADRIAGDVGKAIEHRPAVASLLDHRDKQLRASADGY